MRLAGAAAMIVGAMLVYLVFTSKGGPSSAPGNTRVAVPSDAGQGGPTSLLDPGGAETPVSLAESQVGKRYVFGATTDVTLQTLAFDCSSLVQSVFERLGFKNIPRTSQQQSATATPVSNPQPGDLVFGSFTSPNDHVGIYVGNGQAVSALDEAHGVLQSNVQNWPGVHFGRFQ